MCIFASLQCVFRCVFWVILIVNQNAPFIGDLGFQRIPSIESSRILEKAKSHRNRKINDEVKEKIGHELIFFQIDLEEMSDNLIASNFDPSD